MKSEERNYIVDIEQYFLRLAGRGLMLSARDYGYIKELAERSVSKEMVIKAIAYGFQERKHRKIRSLFAMKREIEEYLEIYLPEQKTEYPEPQSVGFAESKVIEQTLKKIDQLILEEKRKEIRKKYENLRRQVSETESNPPSNIYRRFACLWKNFIEDFFSDLPTERQKEIIAAAESKLPKERNLYDKETKENTLKAFRDEILLETFGINNVFTMNN